MTKKKTAAQRAKAKAAAAANGTGTSGMNGASEEDAGSPEPQSPSSMNGSSSFPSSSTFNIDLDAGLSDAQKAERRKEEGTAAYKKQQYSKALESYSAAVQLAPEEPTYLFNRAAALMALKRYAQAEADCQTVITMQKAAPSSKTFARAGKCQLAQGRVEHALSTLEQAVQLDSSNAAAQSDLLKAKEVLEGVANVDRDRKRKDFVMVLMGLDQLERKIDEVPPQWRIWRVEALLGRKPPKIDEATVLANSILRASPSNPDALYWRGKVMYASGDSDQAVKHWKEALRCDPDYAAAKAAWGIAKQIEAKKEEGNSAFKSGDLEGAIRVYTEALEIDSSNEAIAATLLSNRATAKLKLKQYDEAIADCDACLALSPEHVKALRTQGKCYTAQERWDDAVAALRQAFNNAPEGSQLERETKAELKSAEGDLKRSKMKDHYKIVGVDRDAGEYEIKRAYKKMSLTVHPDKAGGSEAKFKELSESYALLIDPQRRARYDAGEDENEQPDMSQYASAFGGGGGFSHPFFSFSSGGGGMGGMGGSPFDDMFGGGGGRGGFHSHSFRGF